MAERDKNYFKRQLISFSPNFRIDSNFPEMGFSGTDVYKIYGVNDSGDNQSSISLSSGGLFSIYNDHTIQITGGTKNNEKDEDVVIIGRNGNVSITAEGLVRVRGSSIMFEADEDILFKAGRNISFKGGGGRILLDGNKIDFSAPTGSLIDALGQGFVEKVFEGSFVGADVITDFVKRSISNVLSSIF